MRLIFIFIALFAFQTSLPSTARAENCTRWIVTVDMVPVRGKAEVFKIFSILSSSSTQTIVLGAGEDYLQLLVSAVSGADENGMNRVLSSIREVNTLAGVRVQCDGLSGTL
jgi:hypothetical protein